MKLESFLVKLLRPTAFPKRGFVYVQPQLVDRLRFVPPTRREGQNENHSPSIEQEFPDSTDQVSKFSYRRISLALDWELGLSPYSPRSTYRHPSQTDRTLSSAAVVFLRLCPRATSRHSLLPCSQTCDLCPAPHDAGGLCLALRSF